MCDDSSAGEEGGEPRFSLGDNGLQEDSVHDQQAATSLVARGPQSIVMRDGMDLLRVWLLYLKGELHPWAVRVVWCFRCC